MNNMVKLILERRAGTSMEGINTGLKRVVLNFD